MRYRQWSHVGEEGFTLIEIVVVITVIGILTAAAINSVITSLVSARDAQTSIDLATIANQLERDYRTHAAVTGPTYPPTSVGATGIAAIVANAEATSASGQTTNSIVIATTNKPACSTTVTTNCFTVSPGQYVYQPLAADGSLCTVAPCMRFVLYAAQQSSGSTTIVINSMRQQ